VTERLLFDSGTAILWTVPAPSGHKNGVVWHNDAGEKDETVFITFIGPNHPK